MKPIAECLAQGDRNLSQDEELALLHALESGFSLFSGKERFPATGPAPWPWKHWNGTSLVRRRAWTKQPRSSWKGCANSST